MDPAVELNQYIFEEILKYIPTKQLKELTLVNKVWYEAITSSSLLMGKFYLSIRGDWMEKNDITSVVRCSKRSMRKILISDADEIFEEIFEKILARPGSHWTTVEIYGLKFETLNEFVQVLETIQSSIKVLVLNNVKISEPSNNDFKMEMSNLRDLRISFCDLKVTVSMLKSAEKISKLELLHAPEYDENIADYIKDIKSLKKLEMRGEWFAKTFNKSCELQWQLEEFNIVCIDYVMPEHVITNFLHFLEKQQVLKKINLSEWFGLKVLSAIYSIKNLKALSMFISPFFRWNLQALPENVSIEDLDVRSLDVTDEFFNLLILLSASPNLKSLRLRSINEALAYFMKIKLKNLATISLVHSDVTEDIKRILPKVTFV